MIVNQAKQYWEAALPIIEKNFPSPITFQTFILPLKPLRMEQSIFYLQCDSKFMKEVVEKHHLDKLQEAISQVYGTKCQVQILLEGEIPQQNSQILSEAEKKAQREMEANLNPRYVFDSFVVGNSNRMAYAASLAVADAPSRAYNPLFLYGNSGLGKTHLMQSIAHYILDVNPDAKVLYVSSENFTNELILSIQNNKNEEFRNKYRNIDVLLIDDIQFISKKESTQEEFFHTFNALHESNKQIIISSDRPPKEIKTLEDRLRSRFECGLIADIQPPDYETRIAILRKKAERDGIMISDDVLAFIAKNISSNIRELEGALNKVKAYSKLINENFSVSMAEKALKDVFSEKPVVVTPELIQQIVASHYGITVEDIQSSKRPQKIAYPRQIAMYLCRKLTDSSLPKIGESFGGKDHTTVIHAVEKIQTELINNTELERNLIQLEKEIKGQ